MLEVLTVSVVELVNVQVALAKDPVYDQVVFWPVASFQRGFALSLERSLIREGV